jgi:SpoIVB peptidase S55
VIGPRALAALGLMLILALPGAGRAAVAPAETPRAAAPPDGAGPVGMFPVEELRPGLMGVGRTVFEADRLEEFGVEILGVLKNAIGPQQDMILARLHGEKVEFTGVVAGMSGSPVYIDGRLVGALSYRIGQFAKEPIAGITPIADMIKLAPPATGGAAAPGARSGSARPSARPVDLLGWLARGADPAARPALPEIAPGAVATSSAPALQPIGTPLVCAGCDPQALAHYAPVFEMMGLEPTAGGGAESGASEGGPLPLVPGTAIGATLVTGDMNLSAVGTLTHIDGTRVFAFGHPMTGTGTIDVPLTQARVVATLASQAGSFKIANATAPIGAVVEDRLTAIVGEVGRQAPMLPLSVRVNSGDSHRDFHYGITRDRTFGPVVAALATASSLLRSAEFEAGATVSLRYRYVIEGYPTIDEVRLFAGTSPAQPVHAAVANEAAALLGFLSTNPFEEPVVRSIDVTVDVLPPSRIAVLSSLSAAKGEVRAGETVRVDATLTEYRGRTRTESFDVTVPEDTPQGELQVIVAGGSALDGLDRRMIERQVAQAANLRDIINLVGRERATQALVLRLARRSPAVIVRSDILPDLPLSIFSVFNNPRLNADSTLLMEAPILEIARDQDVVVVGGRRISLKVK